MEKFITKLAKNAYKRHTFLREWRAFILLTLVAKLLAMVFSVFAGYFYLNNLFTSALNNTFWAAAFSVITLLIIELTTAIAIFKFFKFVIRGKLLKTALPTLFLVALLFSASFISSTRGLALRQSKKVDNIELIESQYAAKTEQIDKSYRSQKKAVRALISAEHANPQGWSGHKRIYLTAAQLDRIDSYYEDLKNLEAQRKQEQGKINEAYFAEKSDNNKHIEAEADKFYNIVAAIMGVIFVINGLLMFFYSKVYEEREQEAAKIEVLEDFSEEIENKADNMITNAINGRLDLYFEAFRGKAPNVKKGAGDTRRIGFTPQNEKNISQNDKRRSPSVDRLRECKHCGQNFEFKHWNKQFCSEECRIAFWEAKNPGKKIYRKNYGKKD